MIFGLLGVLELVFFSVFFVLLVIGASFDRHGIESPKWYIFGIGLIIVVVYYWTDWTFAGAWETVRSASFWEPVLAYLAAGLVYSVLEFVLAIRRAARTYKEEWAVRLTQRIAVNQLNADGHPIRKETNRGVFVETKEYTLREILQNRDDPSGAAAATEAVRSFIARRHDGIVQLKANDKLEIEPEVNKTVLAESVSAWTFFWPFYAVSLVIGDLLTEIFSSIADFLVAISGRFIRFSFSDVFKL